MGRGARPRRLDRLRLTGGGREDRRDGFPSWGFVGGREVDALRLPLDGPLTGLRFSCPPDRRGCVDLNGFRLLAQGQNVLLTPGEYTVTASSRGDNDGWDRPVTRPWAQRLRTGREDGPWWQLDLSAPVEADSLVVYGLFGQLTSRARQLRVELRDAGGTWYLAWSGERDDAPALADELSAWMSDRDRTRRPVSTLAARLRERELPADRGRLRLIAALLPVGTPHNRPQLNDAEFMVLAHLLCAQRAVDPRTATSVRNFELVLDSRAKLERLMHLVDGLAPRYGLAPQVLTRHGLRDRGSLDADGDALLDLVERVAAAAAEQGLDLMLSYGTLLGAVRDDGFLPHDDDVDVLFALPDPGSHEAREAAVHAVAAGLELHGWSIWHNPAPAAFNFHVTDPATALHLDVFPAFVDGDVAHLHLAAMAMGEMPAAVLSPAQSRRFHGHRVLVPAQPAEFLQVRYGPHWRVTDPWHDWVWELSDTE